MKIYVYAITKNESAHVKRWVNSMQEADGIYVLDTGSTDDTVSLLQNLGVHVQTKIINPWRFDTARNESLNLVPQDADICVCTDLDEVFEPGWRATLEKSWTPTTTKARYNYNWSFNKDGKPLVNFNIEKMHTRKNYHWTHPVHEVLSYTGENETIITINNITLNHYPDTSKSRSSYLPLLELSVKEDPEDDRNMHYLGREYMYYGKYEEAIKTLKKHLSLKSATWKDERSASLRFISRCYQRLDNYFEARNYLDQAILETPYLRDPYVERALLEYHLNNYAETEKYCLKALEIKNHQKTYINEPFSWDNTIYDLLGISCYYLGKLNYAIYFTNIALDMNPTDQRLKDNLIFYKKLEDL